MNLNVKNLKTSFATLLACAALSTQVFAQAVSTPIVGFSTFTAAANGGSGIRYTLVAANLLNSASWSGTLNGSLQASAGSFTAGAFNAGSTYPKFYVEIVDGSAAGSQADIVSNTTDTLTVTGQASFQAAIGAGASVKIRKHRTLVDVFGGATGTAGDTTVAIAKGNSATLADNVLLRDGPTEKAFFYSSNTLRAGWRDGSGNSAADRPIYPTQGITIARRSNSAASITITGEVKEGVTFIDLPAGFNLVTLPVPVDYTLPGFFGGASNLASATDVKIAKGISATAADNVLIAQSNGSYATYFFSSSTLRPGWRDAATGNSAASIQIPGNASIFINKRTSGSLTTTTTF